MADSNFKSVRGKEIKKKLGETDDEKYGVSAVRGSELLLG